MSYIRRDWESHDSRFRICEKYHSFRAQPQNPKVKERRCPRTGEGTGVKQKIINVRQSTSNLTRLLMDNFRIGDWYLTLSLKKLVKQEEMEKAYSSLMRELRKFYRKKGQELKYVSVIENKAGRGRPHLHIIMNGRDIPFMELKPVLEKHWLLGQAYLKNYSGGATDAKKLAAYFTKEDIVTKKDITEEELEKELGQRGRLRASRNLIRTKPTVKTISRSDTFRDEMKPPAGYRLVKELSYSGVNEDGYAYQHAVYERDG